MPPEYVDLKLSGLSVMIGMPTTRDLHPRVVNSLMQTLVQTTRMGLDCHLGLVAGCAVVTWARDEVVHLFLESGAERLFWIDSDIVWKVGDFLRLLGLSTLFDVVAAAYPAKLEPPTFYLHHDGLTPNAYGLIPVKGAGLGFTVVSRRAIEALVAQAPQVRDDVTGRTLAGVFRVGAHAGKRLGEDMAFFADLRAAGYPVHLDPQIDLGHVGVKQYTGSVRDALTPP